MTRATRLSSALWLLFGLLFATITIASVLPVRPLVGVFPFWGAVVLGACLVTVVAGFVVAQAGWPPAEGA